MKWVCCNCRSENDSSYECIECGTWNMGDYVCTECGALNDQEEDCRKCGHFICDKCKILEKDVVVLKDEPYILKLEEILERNESFFLN